VHGSCAVVPRIHLHKEKGSAQTHNCGTYSLASWTTGAAGAVAGGALGYTRYANADPRVLRRARVDLQFSVRAIQIRVRRVLLIHI
jgi:hypothetical protein